MTTDYVQPGRPSGWYKHPTRPVDYFWTGKGFATVNGVNVVRRHLPEYPDYEPAVPADALAWVESHGVAPPSSLPRDRIVTLETLPGYRIARVLGTVTQLTSASGWTAESKGNSALETAMAGLGQAAIDMGADAIVGVRATTFGAHGGITNVMGGDAVGVLLFGTAVHVIKDS